MPKRRGTEHTTLTETAARVVRELHQLPGIKMIAPGEIKTAGRSKTGRRFITVIYTTAGFELLITGQSVQKVAVHTTGDPTIIIEALKRCKSLHHTTFNERERKPGH